MTQPTILFSPRVSAISAQDGVLKVLVRVQAPDQPDQSQAKVTPKRLSLVVDRSGSMDGQPLTEALRCVTHIADCLTPADQLSVVVYDDDIDILRPLALCRNGEYLALDTPGAPLGMYRLIGAAGVNPVLLRICVRGVSLDAIDPVLRATVDRDFVTGFGLKRELTLAKPRQWVAQAYLQWDTEATKAKPHGASGSLGGLEALMLCTAVHIRWKKLTKEK
jgi:hypothetical protein